VAVPKQEGNLQRPPEKLEKVSTEDSGKQRGTPAIKGIRVPLIAPSLAEKETGGENENRTAKDKKMGGTGGRGSKENGKKKNQNAKGETRNPATRRSKKKGVDEDVPLRSEYPKGYGPLRVPQKERYTDGRRLLVGEGSSTLTTRTQGQDASADSLPRAHDEPEE